MLYKDEKKVLLILNCSLLIVFFIFFCISNTSSVFDAIMLTILVEVYILTVIVCAGLIILTIKLIVDEFK